MADNNFWKGLHQSNWPTDPPGWLFLGRAALHLADKMFKDDGLCFRPLPEIQVLLANMEVRGEPLTDESKAILQTDWRERAPQNAQRVREVQEQIRRWAEGAPHLRTGTRPTNGGAPVKPLPSVAWSTQHLGSWFYRCQMNPRDPSSSSFGGDNWEHVFVDRDQFLALVRIDIENAPKDGDAVRAGRAVPVALVAEAAPQKPASNAGRRPNKDQWQQFAAALAVVAALDNDGIEVGGSASAIYDKVAQVLQARLPDGGKYLGYDNVLDAITLAQEWMGRGMPD